jgi:hypothetical protein
MRAPSPGGPWRDWAAQTTEFGSGEGGGEFALPRRSCLTKALLCGGLFGGIALRRRVVQMLVSGVAALNVLLYLPGACNTS